MRFAGSEVSFTPQRFSGSGSGGASAAGSSTLSETFGSTRANAPSYDDIHNVKLQTDSNERQAAMEAEALVAGQGIAAASNVASAGIQAKATVEAAKAEASAAKTAGIAKAGASLLGSVLPAMIPSDERIKENINQIDDALSTLRQLRPVTFHYKDEWNLNSERMHHGFIAQEFQKVVPDATYYDESTDRYCIDTGDLIGLLVRSVQQLEAKVTRLEAQKALEAV